MDDFAEYRTLPGVNWSTLKHGVASMKLLKHRATSPEPDSDAFRLGRAIHCALLEPEKFARLYIAEPDFGDLRTKIAKASREAWRADADPAAVTLKHTEQTVLVGMARGISEHATAMKLITESRHEVTLQWAHDGTGIACKARADLLSVGVADLKSTTCTTLSQMHREAAQYLYHGQLAWYHDGAIASGILAPDAPNPSLIMVQKCEPFDVAVIQLSDTDFAKGRSLWQSLIERYADAQASDWWPGIAPETVSSNLPRWAPDGSETLAEW
jgi:exodeoxyribonuclease VIII